MKISHNTPELLMLDHTPWVLAIVFSGLILLFVGIGLLALGQLDDWLWALFTVLFIFVGGGLWLLALEVFAKRLQFVFDRVDDRISIHRRSLFRNEEHHHRLSRLIEARLEAQTGEGGQTLYRPTLALQRGTGEETVPLHAYFTHGPGPEAMVAAINRWLSESLHIRDDT